jgi:hypothetical protein
MEAVVLVNMLCNDWYEAFHKATQHNTTTVINGIGVGVK